MWLHRLRVAAFGALRDQTLSLAPGLNVVHGPNESAKSTWHAALTVGLCGRRRGGGRRTEEAGFDAQYRPWDGADAWAVTLDLVLDDGRRIEIDRDLASKGASVVDLGLGGRPVEDDLVRDGSPDGAVWLGLDRTTFPATASVRQAELLAVTDHAEGLRDHLARAATGGTGQTAAAAIERLVAFQKDSVGVDRVSAVKPLRRAMDAVAAAEAHLDQVRADHAEYTQLLLDGQRSRRMATDAEVRVREASAAVRLTELRIAESRLAELEALAAEFPDGEPALEEDQGAAELARVVERYRAMAPEPTIELAEAAVLESQIAALPDAPSGPLEIPAGVQEALARERAALDRARVLRGKVSEPRAVDVDPSQVRNWVDALRRDPPPSIADAEAVLDMARHAERERIRQIGRRRGISIGAWIATLAGIGAIAAGPAPIRVIGGVVAALAVATVWWMARRPSAAIADLSAIERDLDELRSQHRVHAEAVDRATHLLVESELPLGERALELAIERHIEWNASRAAQDRAREAEDELSRCRDHTLELFAGLGIDARTAQNGYAELERVVEATRAQATDAARRDGLEASLERRRVFDQQLADHRRSADRIVEALVHAGAAHDLHGAPEQIAVELEAILSRWDETARRLRSRHERWGAYCAALAGADIDDHRDAVARARRELEEGCEEFDPSSLDSIVDPPEALRAASHAVRDAVDRAERAEWAIQQIDASRVDVGGAEAALEHARAELQRVESLRDTLETTRSFLAAAHDHAHRALAPRLEREMTRWVPIVTAGRYVEAQVDPETLAVRVRSRDGQSRDAGLLSHGTAEQVHLALRVVLAQLLTSQHERCPVLLDDPTVHADPERTIEILEWLREVSRDHQVVVFSQEAQVAEWARERLDPDIDTVVRLDSGAMAAGPHSDLTDRWNPLRSVR